MDRTELLLYAQNLLTPVAEKFDTPAPDRLDVYLPAERVVDAVKRMASGDRWHLAAITGLDIPQTHDVDGSIEVLYHFCQHAAIVTLRVTVPYGAPMIPSICEVVPAATLYERELIEMFGVIIEGTPSRDHLLLPDDWPDWVYPLRKSFTGLEKSEAAAIGERSITGKPAKSG